MDFGEQPPPLEAAGLDVDAPAAELRPGPNAAADLAEQPEPPAGGDLAVAAVPRPAAAASGRPRERHRDFRLVWTDVACETCSKVAGQYKLEEGPGGGRDEPTWHMRVMEDDDTWAKTAPGYRRKVTDRATEDEVKNWCRQNAYCKKYHP